MGKGPLGGRPAVAGLVLLAVLAVLACGGPCLARWRWDQVDLTAFRVRPSVRHWLGTTAAGRDVYAITLRGLRSSLALGLTAATLSTALATLTGTVAGYVGGWPDRLLTWAVDLALALPAFLVAAVFSAASRGASWPVLSLLLAGLMWPATARVVRTSAAALREREYVKAARCMGVSHPRIILRHVVPHLSGLLLADAALGVEAAVAGETGLSYFGFGVRPPGVSLGTVLADGASGAVVFPWPFLPAAILLVLVLLAVNLVGDGLRDALAPAVR